MKFQVNFFFQPRYTAKCANKNKGIEILSSKDKKRANFDYAVYGDILCSCPWTCNCMMMVVATSLSREQGQHAMWKWTNCHEGKQLIYNK